MPFWLKVVASLVKQWFADGAATIRWLGAVYAHHCFFFRRAHFCYVMFQSRWSVACVGQGPDGRLRWTSRCDHICYLSRAGGTTFKKIYVCGDVWQAMTLRSRQMHPVTTLGLQGCLHNVYHDHRKKKLKMDVEPRGSWTPFPLHLTRQACDS